MCEMFGVCLSQGTWIIFIVICILGFGGILLFSKKKKPETVIQTYDHSQIQVTDPSNLKKEEVEETEEDEPDIKAGDKFLYGTCNGCPCNLVVADVNGHHGDVTGYFLVDLPAGARNIRTHYDRDEYKIIVCFDKSEGDNAELVFDVYHDPDELSNACCSGLSVDFAEAKALAQTV